MGWGGSGLPGGGKRGGRRRCQRQGFSLQAKFHGGEFGRGSSAAASSNSNILGTRPGISTSHLNSFLYFCIDDPRDRGERPFVSARAD